MYSSCAVLVALIAVSSLGVGALPIASNIYDRSDGQSLSAKGGSTVAELNSYIEKFRHQGAKAAAAHVSAASSSEVPPPASKELSIIVEREDEGDAPAPDASGSEPAAERPAPAGDAAPDAPPTVPPAASASPAEPSKPHRHRYTISSLNSYLAELEAKQKARLAALSAREFEDFYDLD